MSTSTFVHSLSFWSPNIGGGGGCLSTRRTHSPVPKVDYPKSHPITAFRLKVHNLWIAHRFFCQVRLTLLGMATNDKRCYFLPPMHFCPIYFSEAGQELQLKIPCQIRNEKGYTTLQSVILKNARILWGWHWEGLLPDKDPVLLSGKKSLCLQVASEMGVGKFARLGELYRINSLWPAFCLSWGA